MAVSPQVQAYTGAVNTLLAEIGASVDSLVASNTGIVADVVKLKATIDQQQSNPGPISAEDQVLLDSQAAQITALANRLKPVTESLRALDESTAPDAVPEPPVA